MIRDCVIHLLNEQPLLADLIDVPSPGDVALLCTNLRMKNQSRPIFVDHIGSTFVFPYTQVRFVEIPRAAEAEPEAPAAPALAAGMREDEIELDEELLRRVREL